MWIPYGTKNKYCQHSLPFVQCNNTPFVRLFKLATTTPTIICYYTLRKIEETLNLSASVSAVQFRRPSVPSVPAPVAAAYSAAVV